MSMIGNFFQLTPSQLDSFNTNPAEVVSFIYTDEGKNENGIDIDKSWHAIHFMLNGKKYEGNLPLFNVVLGGTEIGGDVGLGPARYLNATEVAEVAETLRSLPPDEFETRYDAAALTANDIYSQIWGEDKDGEDLKYIVSYYVTLRNYYIEAEQQYDNPTLRSRTSDRTNHIAGWRRASDAVRGKATGGARSGIA